MNNNNVFVKSSVLCLLIITSILSVDFQFNLLPFSTIYLIFYVIVVLVLTIWASFLTLQHILNQNTPFTYEKHRFGKRLAQLLPFRISLEQNEPPSCGVDERIDAFVRDIEQQFIRKWYVPYISKDETFLLESRNLMDIVTRRYLQIANQINTDRIMHGILVLLLKHVKEFRRAMKKVKGGSIETHYRYAHIGSKSRDALEHFILQLTSKSLRHFINWELYNSLAAQCVIAIIAKKAVATLLIYISSPGFVNYRILSRVECSLPLKDYAYVSLSDVDHAEVSIDVAEDTPNEADVEDETDQVDASSFIDGKGSTTPILAAQVSTLPVKIHESKATNKTWRNSSDLDCISLGQDILYLSDMDDRGRLWKEHSDSLSEVEEAKPLASVHEDFEMVGGDLIPNFLKPASTGAVTLITNTIKLGNVTEKTMKDLQMSTVNNVMKPMTQATSQAIHKIGDFHDEASGVVGGIIDKGMAGIRKGLLLTGLQDNIQETTKFGARSEKRAIPIKQKLTKLEHVNSDEIKYDEASKSADDAVVWVNPLSSVSPTFDGDILLEKSPIVETVKHPSALPTMEISASDSPDPEYEDTTDLATTTAKLRSLLAQKITETGLNTPSASPLPLSLAQTPLDPSGSCIEELAEVDGALPSMYKAWAKTATGVFQNTLNTLKTALPGNANEQQQAQQQPVEQANNSKTIPSDVEQRDWMYVHADSSHDDLGTHMGRFLNERRAFCTVDDAYEAHEIEMIDHLDSATHLLAARRTFEDEMDDFDALIPMTKTLADLLCELVEDACPPLVKENIVKLMLLVMGNSLEAQLHQVGVKLVKSMNGFIGSLPKFDANSDVLSITADEMINELLQAFPQMLKRFLSDKMIRHVLRVLLESLQSHKINQDTNLQLLELFASVIIDAANNTSPTFSA